MKVARWFSLAMQKMRSPDGRINWRTAAAATYAAAVWTIIGMLGVGYKMGYIDVTEKKEEPKIVVDRKERSRIIAEDVAENKYTPENFIG